jgi:hypothetical protein
LVVQPSSASRKVEAVVLRKKVLPVVGVVYGGASTGAARRQSKQMVR